MNALSQIAPTTEPFSGWVVEHVETHDPAVLTCRQIMASDPSWGPVGSRMILAGTYDNEPEMVRLLSAYRAGQIA
jgi:hypothetical protein